MANRKAISLKVILGQSVILAGFRLQRLGSHEREITELEREVTFVHLKTADYTCAEIKYNEAFKLASGKNKQIAEIKLTRARNCIKWMKVANQAFNSRNYREAKENYQNVLESNPKDTYAKTQLEKCNNALNPPATTLNVSKTNLSFSSSGGNENITVTTNASSYSISVLPSWCAVQKYAEYFVVTCNANTGNATRTGYFTLKAGTKTVRINISQSGVTKRQETTLSIAKENINFSSSGGKSEDIAVYSNASNYSVSLIPSWCSVQTYNEYFVISCNPNYTGQSRSDWFIVTAEEKEVKIYVNQPGSSNNRTIFQKTKTPKSNNKNLIQSGTKNCFNCPKAKYSWGLSLGYVKKNLDYPIIVDYNYDGYSYYREMEGIQVGLRFEPLFKYGFGLNTGLFYEYYTLNLDDIDGYQEYQEHLLSIPLHLEYRFNFSRYFNMFIYGGASGNVITDSSFEEYSFEPTFDYGGGVRIDHFQINIGQKVKKDEYKNLIISCSYMF